MRKKIRGFITILLSLTVFVSQVMVSYATEENEVVQIDTTIDRLNPADYVEANLELVQRGRAAKLQRTSKTLDVQHYYQDGGQTWSADVMQTCGKTIASAGCCLTSFTMIQRYYGGIFNPRGVNNRLGNAACPFEYTTAATTFDYTISNYSYGVVTDDYAIDFIIGAIDSECPVLVGLTPDDTSKSTHFVTAYGYNGNTIYIHDPASSRDYTELSQYLSGYSVHRLYVYTK